MRKKVNLVFQEHKREENKKQKEGDKQQQKEVEATQSKSNEKSIGRKIWESACFAVPVLISYILYVIVAPGLIQARYPGMGAATAGIWSAIIFMILVGIVWYIVSHIWPKTKIQKSLWLFVVLMILYHSVDAYYAPKSETAETANKSAVSATMVTKRVAPRMLTAEEKFQKTLKGYIKDLGAPQKAELNKEGWVDGPKVGEGERIVYLSLGSFWYKGEERGEPDIWNSAVSKKQGVTFSRIKSPSGYTPIYFAKNKKNTIVYYWMERKSVPPKQ